MPIKTENPMDLVFNDGGENYMIVKYVSAVMPAVNGVLIMKVLVAEHSN